MCWGAMAMKWMQCGGDPPPPCTDLKQPLIVWCKYSGRVFRKRQAARKMEEEKKSHTEVHVEAKSGAVFVDPLGNLTFNEEGDFDSSDDEVVDRDVFFQKYGHRGRTMAEDEMFERSKVEWEAEQAVTHSNACLQICRQQGCSIVWGPHAPPIDSTRRCHMVWPLNEAACDDVIIIPHVVGVEVAAVGEEHEAEDDCPTREAVHGMMSIACEIADCTAAVVRHSGACQAVISVPGAGAHLNAGRNPSFAEINRADPLRSVLFNTVQLVQDVLMHIAASNNVEGILAVWCPTEEAAACVRAVLVNGEPDSGSDMGSDSGYETDEYNPVLSTVVQVGTALSHVPQNTAINLWLQLGCETSEAEAAWAHAGTMDLNRLWLKGKTLA